MFALQTLTSVMTIRPVTMTVTTLKDPTTARVDKTTHWQMTRRNVKVSIIMFLFFIEYMLILLHAQWNFAAVNMHTTGHWHCDSCSWD